LAERHRVAVTLEAGLGLRQGEVFGLAAGLGPHQSEGFGLTVEDRQARDVVPAMAMVPTIIPRMVYVASWVRPVTREGATLARTHWAVQLPR
jgi:hypothetical protein